ncbi:hypothetical protein TNIN_346501 [Trichonephila inaurata madagascariensis]|uniref:Uncharacterized protein n=1 Tax=Trichonephila inaurata madagascariensis TaxID=2747483 RepID=A0A8X6WPJ7_9ARAC|nr:hypothetical protein TNIN_346501 [Trichonephila inaurata madagascariensis]
MDPNHSMFILHFEGFLREINKFMLEMSIASTRLSIKITLLNLMPCITFDYPPEAMGASAVESAKVCICYVCNRIEEWINFFMSHDRFFGTYIMGQQLIQMTRNFEGIALSMFDLAVEFESINSKRRSSASATDVI